MKRIGLMVAASVALFAAGSAEAMPVTIPQGASAPVILAMQGCGFGEHRGPYGGCRLNRGPRGALRRALTGAPGGCPPGFSRIAGICRRT